MTSIMGLKKVKVHSFLHELCAKVYCLKDLTKLVIRMDKISAQNLSKGAVANSHAVVIDTDQLAFPEALVDSALHAAQGRLWPVLLHSPGQVVDGDRLSALCSQLDGQLDKTACISVGLRQDIR